MSLFDVFFELKDEPLDSEVINKALCDLKMWDIHDERDDIYIKAMTRNGSTIICIAKNDMAAIAFCYRLDLDKMKCCKVINYKDNDLGINTKDDIVGYTCIQLIAASHDNHNTITFADFLPKKTKSAKPYNQRLPTGQ